MKAFRSMAVVLCSLMASMPALAQTAQWGQVGGWQIRVDRTVGDGCFAVQEFEGDTIVRIGYDAAAKRMYLLFTDDDWKSLEVDKVYPVRIVFDGSTSFNGEMTGLKLGKSIWLAHRNVSSDLVQAFMERNTMRIFYQGTQIAHLSLRNTFAALMEVVTCQKAMSTGTAPGKPAAPIAPQPKSNDPFR